MAEHHGKKDMPKDARALLPEGMRQRADELAATKDTARV